MAYEGQIRLGGLWKKKGKSGAAFYAGTLGPDQVAELRNFLNQYDGGEFVLFQNRDKRSDSSPDLNLLLSPPYNPDGGDGGGGSRGGGANGGGEFPPPADDDDVRF